VRIFSYWIYAGVDGNVQMAFAPCSPPVVPLAAVQSAWKSLSGDVPSLAVHVPSVGVAGERAMVEGLHVDVGGVGGVTDVPSLLVLVFLA
jgi:hypothetical protein